MDELAIKAAVISHVRQASGRRAKPLVAPEFSLGSSNVRADLALLGDDFIGIEIKSGSDSLRRLQNQLVSYRRYFDYVILVVAQKHLRGIDEGWLDGAALWQATQSGQIIEVIPGRNIPHEDADSYLDLLTQEERRRFWRARDRAGTAVEARIAFQKAFRFRYGNTSDQFWQLVKGRKVQVSDLTVLSRFAGLREAQRKHAEEREAFWREWAAQNRIEDS